MQRVVGIIVGGIALGSFLVACAADATGDDTGNEDPINSSSSSSGATTSSSAERPDFDASFADAGTQDSGDVDPTPPNGDVCVDPNDPGGSENLGLQLPATTDCDNDFKNVKGVMNGAVDVDFYKMSGTDKLFCSLDTEFNSSTSGVELCVYARCKNDTSNAVTGCVDGVEDQSVTGMKGCCTNAPGKATPKWDCSGITDNDSADFVIRVRQSSTAKDQCLAYSFNYRF